MTASTAAGSARRMSAIIRLKLASSVTLRSGIRTREKWLVTPCGRNASNSGCTDVLVDGATTPNLRRKPSESGIRRPPFPPPPSSSLDESLFALLAHRRHDDDQQQERGDHEHRQADRPREEHDRVSAREQHRAAQVLLHERTEDEAEDQRRGLALELDEDVADDAEDRGLHDVERRVRDAVHADAAEQQDRRIEQA